MGKASDLHWAIARAFASAEEVTERHSIEGDNALFERFEQLLYEPEERNPLIWARVWDEYGLDDDLADDSIAVINLVPEADRTVQLRLFEEALFVAAYGQAIADTWLLELWEVLESGSRAMLAASDRMNVAELTAASFGPGKLMFEEAKRGLFEEANRGTGTEEERVVVTLLDVDKKVNG